MSTFQLSTGIPTLITTSLTDTLADPGNLKILVFVISIPLVFYILYKTINLFSTENKSTEKLIARTERNIRKAEKYQNQETNFLNEFKNIGKN